MSRCRVHLPQYAILLSWGRLWAGPQDPRTTLDLKLLTLGSVGLSIRSSCLLWGPLPLLPFSYSRGGTKRGWAARRTGGGVHTPVSPARSPLRPLSSPP